MPFDISTEFLPIYEEGTGRVHGFEALSRGPGDARFRELYASAKRSNELSELDRQCHRSAFLAARSLGSEQRLFVNVFPSSIANGGILSELEQAPVQARQVILQLVPFERIDDFPALLAALEPIEELGCELALDGFGTGFASLASLRMLRFHYLKVGRNFIDDPSPEGLMFLTAIGGLTKAFRLRFVVSGIESQEQLSTALAGGADFVEGYYLSKPSPRLQCAPLATLASS